MSLHTFFDGSGVEFSRGNFDQWCVYHIGIDGSRRPPRDTDYFAALPHLALIVGAPTLYQDFVAIYDRVRWEPELMVFEEIDQRSSRYHPQELQFQQCLTFMYLGMIAEENKENTKLGKRIKRLGVHSILVEGKPIDYAANFMRGMKWPEISKMCHERGF